MTRDPAAKEGHTPAPWCAVGLYIESDSGYSIANVIDANGFDQNKANARRIVACVNACEGLSVEELEQYAKHAPYTAYTDLKSDRDHLRERVKELEAVAQMFLEAFEGPACCEAKSAMGNDAMPELLRVGEIARSALSKSPK